MENAPSQPFFFNQGSKLGQDQRKTFRTLFSLGCIFVSGFHRLKLLFKLEWHWMMASKVTYAMKLVNDCNSSMPDQRV
jgi:hypothetical protein